MYTYMSTMTETLKFDAIYSEWSTKHVLFNYITFKKKYYHWVDFDPMGLNGLKAFIVLKEQIWKNSTMIVGYQPLTGKNLRHYAWFPKENFFLLNLKVTVIFFKSGDNFNPCIKYWFQFFVDDFFI